MEIKLFEKVIIEYSYGINLDLIIDKFRVFAEDFICGVCEKLVVSPIFCGTCSIMYCKNCVDCTKQENCPKCKFHKLIDSPRFNLNILQKFILKCPYSGCDKTINYMKFEEHLKNCDYAINKCLSCDFQNTKIKTENHVKKCENITINCEFCGEKIIRRNYKDHIKSCTDNFIDCLICKESVDKINYINHNFGQCFKKMNNSHLEDKTSESTQLHFEIEHLKNKISSLQIDNSTLNQKNTELKAKLDDSQRQSETLKMEKLELQKDINTRKINKENTFTIEEEKESFLIKSIECSFCSSKSRTMNKLCCNFSICAKCKSINKTCMCIFCSQLSKAISNKIESQDNRISTNEKSSILNIDKSSANNIVNQKSVKEIKLFHKKCEKCLKSNCACDIGKKQRVISSCEEEICKEKNIQNNYVDLTPKEILIGTSNGLLMTIDLLRKTSTEIKIHNKKINSLLGIGKNIISVASDGFIRRFEQMKYSNCLSELSNNGEPITSAVSIDDNQIICGFENKNSVSLFEIDNNKIIFNKEFTSNINYPIQSLCRFTNDLVLCGEKEGLNGKILFLNLNKNMIQFSLETGANVSVNNIIKLKNSFSNNFLSTSTNGFIKLWDLKAKMIQNHEANFAKNLDSKLAQLLDERIIFSSDDYSIRFLDLKSNKLSNDPICHHKNVVLDFCQIDSSLVASCSKDGSIALWDLRKNSLLSKIDLPKDYYGNVCLKLSDDSNINTSY